MFIMLCYVYTLFSVEKRQTFPKISRIIWLPAISEDKILKKFLGEHTPGPLKKFSRFQGSLALGSQVSVAPSITNTLCGPRKYVKEMVYIDENRNFKCA